METTQGVISHNWQLNFPVMLTQTQKSGTLFILSFNPASFLDIKHIVNEIYS